MQGGEGALLQKHLSMDPWNKRPSGESGRVSGRSRSWKGRSDAPKQGGVGGGVGGGCGCWGCGVVGFGFGLWGVFFFLGLFWVFFVCGLFLVFVGLWGFFVVFFWFVVFWGLVVFFGFLWGLFLLGFCPQGRGLGKLGEGKAPGRVMEISQRKAAKRNWAREIHGEDGGN